MSLGARTEQVALPLALLLMIVVFGSLRPDVFLTWSNVANILGSQSVLFVLVMAVLLPLIVGDFDLSIGGIMGLSGMLAGVLNTHAGWGIVPACIAGVLAGAAAGFINGLFVVYFDSDALIVTLGTGTVYTGIIFFLAGSSTITGIDPALSFWTFSSTLLGIPLEFYYGLIILLIVWYVSTFTPLGLRAAFVGQSRDVALLSGIRVVRMRWWAFVLAGIVGGLAGIFFLGTTGSADPTASGPYLLPAFAAAFLGATSIKPGRFNAFGAGIAVFFLATGVTGLQLLGAENYVQQVFYGAALVLAVVISRQLRKITR
jgi:ribose transport system permease protein